MHSSHHKHCPSAGMDSLFWSILLYCTIQRSHNKILFCILQKYSTVTAQLKRAMCLNFTTLHKVRTRWEHLLQSHMTTSHNVALIHIHVQTRSLC